MTDATQGEMADMALREIKQLGSPTIDRSDAHGARSQGGVILWDNQDPFIRAAIAAVLSDARRAVLKEAETAARDIAAKFNPLSSKYPDTFQAGCEAAADVIAALGNDFRGGFHD